MKRAMITMALVAIVLAVTALVASADAPLGPYFNGFEANTSPLPPSSWSDLSNGGDGSITRQPSGYTNGGYANAIPSATGGYHARLSGDPCVVPTPCFGPFTRWGGYSQAFPLGG